MQKKKKINKLAMSQTHQIYLYDKKIIDVGIFIMVDRDIHIRLCNLFILKCVNIIFKNLYLTRNSKIYIQVCTM